MKNSHYTSILAILVALVIAVGAYWYFSADNSILPESGTLSGEATATAAPQRQIPSGWKEYRSSTYYFLLLYPQELSVREYDEGGGAFTISFENAPDALGFQIFIVPHNESRVSEKRFLKDVPSGVREGIVDLTIDGVVGSAFYSRNMILGEMWEVWFIENDLLYEVTTLKSLDFWLAEILNTWQFMSK